MAISDLLRRDVSAVQLDGRWSVDQPQPLRDRRLAAAEFADQPSVRLADRKLRRRRMHVPMRAQDPPRTA